MDQKQRNKIAWILIVVFVPILIYLFVANIAKIGKTTSPQPSPAAADAGPIDVSVAVQPPPNPAVDPKISAEQQRISKLLPGNNPFNPSRSVIADPLPVMAAPDTPATPATAEPPVTPDAGIRLTAIVSRQGGAARMAMINGRFLGEGDRTAGWTIVKVNARDVLLQDGDRQMILRLK